MTLFTIWLIGACAGAMFVALLNDGPELDAELPMAYLLAIFWPLTLSMFIGIVIREATRPLWDRS